MLYNVHRNFQQEYFEFVVITYKLLQYIEALGHEIKNVADHMYYVINGHSEAEVVKRVI